MILQVLAVCLSHIMYLEQTYHSYPRKVKKINTGINRLQPQIFCHKKLQANDGIYHDLQCTVLESFQKITLKMLIHRDVCFYVFKHLNMDWMEGSVLIAPTEVLWPSESGQQTKNIPKAMEKDYEM